MVSAIKPIFDSVPDLSQGDIDAVLTSTNSNNKYLANIVSELSGISPKIAHSVESLCNSGTNCIVSAYAYISSGLVDTALIIGSEKADSPGLVLDWDKSRSQYKHPIYWSSMFTSAHKRKFGTTLEDLAYVGANNHRNALDTPYAYFEKPFSVEEIMESKPLTENLRLLDCSMPCNGSAAILLASENVIKNFCEQPIWMTGIGHPLGATGIDQTIEICQQLQGKAGKRQIDGAKTGLIHNMSAAATSSTVLILES